ncbi:MAG: UDP-N-acetylmuramate--L-alanine ligase [Rhodospirillaceae bacterium]|nr:UDP-N-acetylmuramate--L-alanine ligase [Rhodospirillaceae bacterium]
MRKLPIDIGIIHFIGIGGIGMSGIAEVLHNLRYHVQGSDISESPNVARLKKLGIVISIGQDSKNVTQASIVVVSTAIKSNNPELEAARKKQIPIVHRAEMLGELMRLKWSIACAGTHGKTTTTSLVASLLDGADLDPTVINGGVINSYGTNARLGDGDWMVVEADESDGSFDKLPATIAVVTNIDPEHLDFYGDFSRLKQAFKVFLTNIPFYGFAVVCIDHPVVRELITEIPDRRIITYGTDKSAEVQVLNIQPTQLGSCFDVVINDRSRFNETLLSQLELPMHGKHNVLNSAAAVAIANEMGMLESVIRKGLAEFQGVKRRFTRTGESNSITVIDDYGHHPVEIEAALSAARLACQSGKVIAVFQPHRYSRLRDLFDEFCGCFKDADIVFVADVYAAGEEPILGFDRDKLVGGIARLEYCKVIPLLSPVALASNIADVANEGDLVLCLGAGNITSWANSLPSELDHIFANDSTQSSNLKISESGMIEGVDSDVSSAEFLNRSQKWKEKTG